MFSRAGRALDGEVVTVVVMKLLQRLDDQVIDREPDRSAPVRIAAEEARPRFGRFVVDRVELAAGGKDVRLIQMLARERSYAIRRQELRFVEHSPQQFLHSAAAQ